MNVNSGSPTDGHGLRALDFPSKYSCEQIYGKQHTGLFRPPFCWFTWCCSCFCCNSYRNFRSLFNLYIIKTDQALLDVLFFDKTFIRWKADWRGIWSNLFNIGWPHINCLLDSVSALNDCIVDTIYRHIPSHNLKICIKEKAWLNDECR